MTRVTTTSTGLPGQPSWSEAPQSSGLDGFIVKAAGIERLPDADVADAPLSCHHNIEPHLALDSSFQRLAGVVGSDLRQQSWRSDRATFTIRAAEAPA